MTIDEAIERIEDIPTIPTILGDILRITSLPCSAAKDLSRIIYQDQSIASKILRMANSSYYGLSQQVQTIERAIVILGFDEIRSIAMAMSVFDSVYLKKGGVYYNRLRSWNHSLFCGLGAKMLGDLLGFDKGALPELFLAGLLHDIGKVLIDRYFSKDFAGILDLVEKKSLFIHRAEHEVLGFDHAQLGGCLLKKWNFSTLMVNMVRYHHQPHRSLDHQDWISLIYLADYMCHQLGYSAFVCEPKPQMNEILELDLAGLTKKKGFLFTPQSIPDLLVKMEEHFPRGEQWAQLCSSEEYGS